MRPLFILLPILAVLMIGGLVIAEQSDDSDAQTQTWQSGNCTVTMDDNGIVTVSGNGAMQDYDSASAQPWYSQRANMVKLIIKDGVTKIGVYCFREQGIKSIEWPESSLTTLGNGAFLASGLKWVSLPDSITTWKNGIFQNCGSLQQAELPSNMTAIPQSMFMNCTSLIAIDIPTSVESIGVSAFNNTGLTSVYIPDEVETIGNYAFQNCTSLAFARIGMGYDGTGGGIFAGCTALEKAAFAEGLMYIGESMFNGCTSLKTISLPSTMREIKQDAFRNTPALTWQAIPSSIRTVGSNVFTASDLKGLLFFGATWNGSSIQNNSFSSTESTVSVWSTNNVANAKLDGKGGSVNFLYNTLPATQSWTSGQCTLTLTTTTGLLTITGTGAMADYTSSSSVPWLGNFAQLIKVIKVGSGVTKIGNMSFYDDRNLLSGLNRIYWDSGGQANLTIGATAFHKCYTLETISLPSSCVGIGDNAFNECRGVRSFTFPAQLTSIGANAFRAMHSLKELDINLYSGGWGQSGQNWVSGQYLLKSFKVASGNTAYKVVNGALARLNGDIVCFPRGMLEYTVPSGSSSILDYAGFDCKLGKLVIPSHVTSIGTYAFHGCTNMTEIDYKGLSWGVTSIGNLAFNMGASGKTVNALVFSPNNVANTKLDAYKGSYTDFTYLAEPTITVTFVSSDDSYGTVGPTSVHLTQEGGTITVSGNNIVIRPAGSSGSVTATATPAAATVQYTYAFANWSGVPSGGTITSDVTITANFTRTVNEYTVTFEVNNDEYGSVSPASVTVPYGSQIRTSSSSPSTLTVGDNTITATRTPWTPGAKYYFDNWSGIPSPATVTGDLTITANFHQDIVQYTLTFTVDPLGYGNISPSTVTADYGTPITMEDNRLHIGDTTVIPIPLGPTEQWRYSFSEWRNLPETVTGDAAVTGVFARDPVMYTVTYDGNTGTPETQTEDVAYGARADLSGHTAEKEGWAFLGWNTDRSQTVPLSEYTVTEDATLYAVFAEIVEYDIPVEEYIDGITHTEYSSGGLMGTIFMIIPLLLGLAIVMFLARSMGYTRRRSR